MCNKFISISFAINIEPVRPSTSTDLLILAHCVFEFDTPVSSDTLYRDIKDTTVGTLSQRITNQVHGLKGLNSKLLEIRSYLERVTAGKLPINHQIIYQLQDVFNLLPDVNLLVSCLYMRGNLFVSVQ